MRGATVLAAPCGLVVLALSTEVAVAKERETTIVTQVDDYAEIRAADLTEAES